MKKNKLIMGVDNDIYNDFVNICKKQEINIAEKLNEVMKEEVRKYNKNNVQAKKAE